MKKKHFTLVEIMIVVAIIGLLAAIGIPSFMRARASAQANSCISNMRNIDTALQQYVIETNDADYDGGDDGNWWAVLGGFIDGSNELVCPVKNDHYSVDAAKANATERVTCSFEPGGSYDGPAHVLPVRGDPDD